MQSAPDLDRHVGPGWRGTVNRVSIAAVFYLCLLLVLSHMVTKLAVVPAGEWALSMSTYLRQTLISGMTLLVAAGAVEALIARRRIVGHAALAWRVAAVMLGAALGPPLRLWTSGATSFRPEGWGFFLFVTLTWGIVGAMGSLLIHVSAENRRSAARLQQAALEREALDARRLEAELMALQAQIEPHFLFNTLAHVKRLYETEADGVRGRDMLLGLIDYLRAVLPDMRQGGSTLRRELEMTRSFLGILQLRMGERLRFDIRADDALLDAAMPPLMIATLVENAVKHGIGPQPEGGRIVISAERLDDGRLCVQVEDDGRGFVASGGSGVGLANTRSRLSALFGDRAALDLAAGAVQGVIARVVLPLRPGVIA